MTVKVVDRATDQELVELFSLDSVAELEGIASGKRSMLFIGTCDGQWSKYEGETSWLFQADPNDGEIGE